MNQPSRKLTQPVLQHSAQPPGCGGVRKRGLPGTLSRRPGTIRFWRSCGGSSAISPSCGITRTGRPSGAAAITPWRWRSWRAVWPHPAQWRGTWRSRSLSGCPVSESSCGTVFPCAGKSQRQVHHGSDHLRAQKETRLAEMGRYGGVLVFCDTGRSLCSSLQRESRSIYPNGTRIFQ